METKYIASGAIVVIIVVGLMLVSASAENNSSSSSSTPVIPAVFWGKLTTNGQPIQNGLTIEAFINGISCGQASKTENGMYVSVVRGNDVFTPGCGEQGDLVDIMVNGEGVTSGTWASGALVQNDVNMRTLKTSAPMPKPVTRPSPSSPI